MVRGAAIMMMLALAIGFAGCGEQTRVVHEGKRFLESVPGAQVGGEDAESKDSSESESGDLVAGVTSASLDQSRLPQPGEVDVANPDEPAKDELVDTQADGSITLKARTVREVLVHVSRIVSLDGDEGERYQQAFTRDVLSGETKRHFQAQSKDASKEALAYLRDNRAAINKLLTRMPAAENSPSVLFSSGGANQFKLEVVGPASRGLKFTELWVANEKGQWKFMWVR